MYCSIYPRWRRVCGLEHQHCVWRHLGLVHVGAPVFCFCVYCCVTLCSTSVLYTVMHWSVSVTECAPLWTWGWRSVTSRGRQCAVHQCVVEAATALWATTELGNWTQSVTKVDWTSRALDSPQILILRIQIAAKMLINTNSDTGDVGRKRLAALPLSIIQSSDKKMGKKIGTVPKGEDWVSLDARRRWRRRRSVTIGSCRSQEDAAVDRFPATVGWGGGGWGVGAPKTSNTGSPSKGHNTLSFLVRKFSERWKDKNVGTFENHLKISLRSSGAQLRKVRINVKNRQPDTPLKK